jgi:hypothetical protein
MIQLAALVRLLAVIALGGALLAGCQPGTPTQPTPPAPAPSGAENHPASGLPKAATEPGLTPQQRLSILADTISASPTDSTIALPYTYLHVQTWARATTTITRTDRRQYRLDRDGSEQTLTRALPDVPGLTHAPTSAEHKRLAAAPVARAMQPAGSPGPHLPQPLPTDPDALADFLAPRELRGKAEYPRVLTAGVIGLAIDQFLTRDQRAVTLCVLARISELDYAGITSDIAGRAGLTFTVTVDTTTTLIIDPRTGELLAAHERSTTGHRPGLWFYVLILDRTHTRQPQP